MSSQAANERKAYAVRVEKPNILIPLVWVCPETPPKLKDLTKISRTSIFADSHSTFIITGNIEYISSSLRCLEEKRYVVRLSTSFIFNFVDTPRNFIIAKLSIRKPGSSSTKLNIIFFHHANFQEINFY